MWRRLDAVRIGSSARRPVAKARSRGTEVGMMSETLIVPGVNEPMGPSWEDRPADTPAPGDRRTESHSCSIWALGLPADAVGPLEWWPPKRLRPYTPRHVRVPTFRGTPSWAILQHLVKESGVREALLVLPDGQVVDGRHRFELAKGLRLPEVPVRVLAVPQPLGDEDRLQLDTTLAVLAAGRRHLAPSRVPGLLLGLTEAERATGVLNRPAANLRRGRAPAPGRQGPTQRELAASTGMSARTVRRLVRVSRDGSPELRRAVASGDVSVKEADRRLATATINRAPSGPLALRALPTPAIGRSDPEPPSNGSGPPLGQETSGASPLPPLAQPASCPAESGPGAGSSAGTAAPPPPAAVQAFLALCYELDAATARFRRATAHWTAERRAQRRLTIWQMVQHLSEQFDWMQGAEGSRHDARPR
jgi:hypothetical protein